MSNLDFETKCLCWESTSAFASAAFPHTFYAPFNAMHRRILDVLDARDDEGFPLHKRVVIRGSRGLGKTTLTLLGHIARQIVYRDCGYVTYITSTAPAAVEKTETLKQELLQSRFVRSEFGRIDWRPTDVSVEFSKEGFVCLLEGGGEDYRGTVVMPLSTDQQVRGRGKGAARPDRIIGDDIDDPKIVVNEQLRERAKEWWYADVLPSVSQYNRNTQVIYLGTITHDDCLLNELADSSDWHLVDLPVCNEDFLTLCPEYMSQVELDRWRALYDRAGRMAEFRREFMMKKGGKEEAPIRQDMFRYYDEVSEPVSLVPGIQTVILVDPAKSDTMKSCDSAVVGISIDRRHTVKMYVRDCFAGRYHPDELCKQAIAMAFRLNARTIAVESTGLGLWITDPMKQAIAACGRSFEFKELHAKRGQGAFSGEGGGKKLRIQGLSFFYRSGMVYHNANGCCSGLEKVLLAHPNNMGKVDEADAAGYIVEFCDMDQILFGNRHVPEYEKVQRFSERYAKKLIRDARVAPIRFWKVA